MKKIFLLLIIPLFGLTQNNKLENKSGFKDFVFGDSPSAHKNMTLEIDEDNTKLYSLQENDIKIDSVEFEYIRVTFLKDKLSSISIQTKNGTGFVFLNLLKESYGNPTKSNLLKKNYEWLLNTMRILYENLRAEKDAVITFYSKK
ncbi:MAG: hypothetical protein Q7W45_06415 [Bacteroidota bacterium]|nr:hypothetical protein [Bacteroidota bacterium]MDP3145081.1 hypothetical protein [Bacteroidota bacterium]